MKDEPRNARPVTADDAGGHGRPTAQWRLAAGHSDDLGGTATTSRDQ